MDSIFIDLFYVAAIGLAISATSLAVGIITKRFKLVKRSFWSAVSFIVLAAIFIFIWANIV